MLKLEDIDDKKVMHIDTSIRFYENANTGIAFKIISSNEHKGLVLTNSLKKELERDINISKNYPKLYAICIYKLIENDLNNFDILVICGDEKFEPLKQVLNKLFENNNEFEEKHIICIGDLRNITGKPNLKSYADKFANIYRKKALRQPNRKNRGIPLNIVKVSYREIVEIWNRV